MWCPNCHREKTRVIGTDKSYVVERFRRCDDCGYSFNTLETQCFDPDWAKNAGYSQAEAARIQHKRQLKEALIKPMVGETEQ